VRRACKHDRAIISHRGTVDAAFRKSALLETERAA